MPEKGYFFGGNGNRKKPAPGRDGPEHHSHGKASLLALGPFDAELLRGELRPAGVIQEPCCHGLVLPDVFLRFVAGYAELDAAHGLRELVEPWILERLGEGGPENIKSLGGGLLPHEGAEEGAPGEVGPVLLVDFRDRRHRGHAVYPLGGDHGKPFHIA
ncbi:hypothetical protein SDC9_71973 [bioreactor metagenome]|uniref:Uncharacterized protein n=1 Tax=bioreactor metagenome TaxID=1076179 RepID=A0A644YAZ3_9ZZZZ